MFNQLHLSSRERSKGFSSKIHPHSSSIRWAGCNQWNASVHTRHTRIRNASLWAPLEVLALKASQLSCFLQQLSIFTHHSSIHPLFRWLFWSFGGTLKDHLEASVSEGSSPHHQSPPSFSVLDTQKVVGHLPFLYPLIIFLMFLLLMPTKDENRDLFILFCPAASSEKISLFYFLLFW